jgi:anti-anti-sigma factor
MRNRLTAQCIRPKVLRSYFQPSSFANPLSHSRKRAAMDPHLTVRVTDFSVEVHLLATKLHETNIRSIGAQLDELAEQVGQSTLRLDFGRVEYLTSTVLGKLVSLHTQVKHAGGHFQVVNVHRDVYDLFEATRLNTFIDVQPLEEPQTRLVM